MMASGVIKCLDMSRQSVGLGYNPDSNFTRCYPDSIMIMKCWKWTWQDIFWVLGIRVFNISYICSNLWLGVHHSFDSFAFPWRKYFGDRWFNHQIRLRSPAGFIATQERQSTWLESPKLRKVTALRRLRSLRSKHLEDVCKTAHIYQNHPKSSSKRDFLLLKMLGPHLLAFFDCQTIHWPFMIFQIKLAPVSCLQHLVWRNVPLAPAAMEDGLKGALQIATGCHGIQLSCGTAASLKALKSIFWMN